MALVSILWALRGSGSVLQRVSAWRAERALASLWWRQKDLADLFRVGWPLLFSHPFCVFLQLLPSFMLHRTVSKGTQCEVTTRWGMVTDQCFCDTSSFLEGQILRDISVSVYQCWPPKGSNQDEDNICITIPYTDIAIWNLACMDSYDNVSCFMVTLERTLQIFFWLSISIMFPSHSKVSFLWASHARTNLFHLLEGSYDRDISVFPFIAGPMVSVSSWRHQMELAMGQVDVIMSYSSNY